MDIATLIKLGESYGAPFLIFIVLVYFINTQNKQHQQQIIAMQQRDNIVYEQMKDTLAVLQQLVAQQSRIETKIDSNQFCPVVRREGGK